MALMFSTGSFYSRVDVWNQVRPGEDFPVDGDWLTGYVEEAARLFIFAEVEAEGADRSFFANTFDPATGQFQWCGKPIHIQRSLFSKIFFKDKVHLTCLLAGLMGVSFFVTSER